MLRKTTTVLVVAAICSSAMAIEIDWVIGIESTNLLVIAGSLTTEDMFAPDDGAWEIRLMRLGTDWMYSEERGYSHFRHAGTGAHSSLVDGRLSGLTPFPDDSSYSYNQYMVALFEKATGKFFCISESAGGSPITPYTLPEISDDPFLNGGPLFDSSLLQYYPTSSTGNLFKGAEIPPFCGWLSKHNRTEADLTGLETNQVNLAFSVDVDPLDFSGITLAVTNLAVNISGVTGGFVFESRDGAETPTAVTRLNDPAAFVLRKAASLNDTWTTGSEAALSLETGTFEAETTGNTHFIRLDLIPAETW